VAYNQGMVFRRLGQPTEARSALTEARALDPQDPRVLHALVELAIESRDWTEAAALIDELDRLQPDSPLPPELRRRLEAARTR
jgi:Tfp pilus assembly protein PilF